MSDSNSVDQRAIKEHIYNACNPWKSATEEYYVDCTDARGSRYSLVQEFQRHLDNSTKNHRCFLFSGHLGCGKSSELRELERDLERPEPGEKRYFTVYIDADDYLDVYDVSPTDIQLAIVAEVVAALRDRLHYELQENYFVRRFNEIKRYFFSEEEMNDAELNLGLFKFKLQRLKRNPDARQQVRAQMQQRKSTIIEEINSVFDEVRARLNRVVVAEGQSPYTDVVVIMDSLERIQKVENFPEGFSSQRELFIERYQQLVGMRAHIIYTVPLRLVRSPDGPQLIQRYGSRYVLPMVKIKERKTGTPYEAGIRLLKAMLEHRIGNHSLEDIFTPGALDFLITYSGGNVRELMMFVQNAIAYSDHLPIPLNVAYDAIAQSVSSFSTSIPESHWKKLVQLDLSEDQKIPNNDPDYYNMLENLTVLEYVNGGTQANRFESIEPWYVVNPIVRELQKFKSTRKALESGSQK